MEAPTRIRSIPSGRKSLQITGREVLRDSPEYRDREIHRHQSSLTRLTLKHLTLRAEPTPSGNKTKRVLKTSDGKTVKVHWAPVWLLHDLVSPCTLADCKQLKQLTLTQCELSHLPPIGPSLRLLALHHCIGRRIDGTREKAWRNGWTLKKLKNLRIIRFDHCTFPLSFGESKGKKQAKLKTVTIDYHAIEPGLPQQKLTPSDLQHLPLSVRDLSLKGSEVTLKICDQRVPGLLRLELQDCGISASAKKLDYLARGGCLIEGVDVAPDKPEQERIFLEERVKGQPQAIDIAIPVIRRAKRRAKLPKSVEAKGRAGNAVRAVTSRSDVIGTTVSGIATLAGQPQVGNAIGLATRGVGGFVQQRTGQASDPISTGDETTQRNQYPIAVLYFAGPAGTGKTMLARTVAEALDPHVFDPKAKKKRWQYIEYDMTQFSSPSEIYKLTGSNPGYRDSGAVATLVDKIVQNPNAVIVFNEIEKAHSKVREALYPIMEGARFQDGLGKIASFNSTIIIMTSNLGEDELASMKWPAQPPSARKIAAEKAQKTVQRLLRQDRPGAFRSRLDHVVPFRSIDQTTFCTIMRMQAQTIQADLLRETGVDALIKESAITLYTSSGVDPTEGVRQAVKNFRRKIEGLIKDALADEVIGVGTYCTVYVEDPTDDKATLELKPRAAPSPSSSSSKKKGKKKNKGKQRVK